ncbi:hypothetical protein BS78_09G258500 [Paspalum vaginatum]|nr:hypothetical protein BS78_09G258500 [Paspalum vaginatum]
MCLCCEFGVTADSLKQLVLQYEEQLKTLEINNYAPRVHLKQAQNNSFILCLLRRLHGRFSQRFQITLPCRQAEGFKKAGSGKATGQAKC